MQLKKINQDHYIVVTDEPVTKGDWYISPSGGIISDRNGTELLPDGWKKITHSTQPLDQVNQPQGETSIGMFMMGKSKIQHLDLSYIKSLVGEVDIEKKAYYVMLNYLTDGNPYSELKKSTIGADANKAWWIKGYSQCLEDNKDKRFTEEDMRKAIQMSKDIKYVTYSEQDIVDSLTQPKDTWEVEFIDGQLKLK